MVAAPSVLLPELLFWQDDEPRSVTEQMALDEAIWRVAKRPILRVHGWERACVTFGYFLRWQDMADRVRAAGVDEGLAVRRHTGGGLVFHERDVAFTLVIPVAAWEGEAKFKDSQVVIHRALGCGMNVCGIEVEEVACETGKDLDCFQHPVAHDLALNGVKVVGAGQRRSREGLLHQGSVQEPSLGRGWAWEFARQLSRQARVVDDGEGEVAEALALVGELEGEYASVARRVLR